ncbi:MAG: hypothetical protein KBD31_01115 [Proteobacteria bacterium]|nr:hypothetical protein [Pseudomonadota bacterium]
MGFVFIFLIVLSHLNTLNCALQREPFSDNILPHSQIQRSSRIVSNYPIDDHCLVDINCPYSYDNWIEKNSAINFDFVYSFAKSRNTNLEQSIKNELSFLEHLSTLITSINERKTVVDYTDLNMQYAILLKNIQLYNRKSINVQILLKSKDKNLIFSDNENQYIQNIHLILSALSLSFSEVSNEIQDILKEQASKDVKNQKSSDPLRSFTFLEAIEDTLPKKSKSEEKKTCCIS